MLRALELSGATRPRVCLEELIEGLVVEGVAPLGPVDREQCDVAPVLQVDHGRRLVSRF
jgi:hypothetical protein